MELWQRFNDAKDFEPMEPVYPEPFSFIVREVCAQWIDERVEARQFFFINDPDIEQKARNFLDTMIEQLEQEKHKIPEELPKRQQLEDAIQTFRKNVLYTPFAIYKQIRDVIIYEQHFLEQKKVIEANISEHSSVDDPEANDIRERINNLFNKIWLIKQTENLYKKDMQLLLQTPGNTLTDMERTNNERFQLLYYYFHQTVENIKIVQHVVTISRLGKWKRNQVLAGNGAEMEAKNNLDEIQVWFGKIAEIIWTARCSLDELRKMNSYFEVWFETVNNIFITLIISSFIIEEQPPQIMKTNTKFKSTVRLLLPNLGVQANPLEVSILSESQAQSQTTQNMPLLDNISSGEIKDNTIKGEINWIEQKFLWKFRNLKLLNIKRADKKLKESVMDEKFTLIFKLALKTGPLPMNIWVMSLPVVVIVHGNQEQQSCATITWDNAFSELERVPFGVPGRVIWYQLAATLNLKFYNLTKRGLTTENLDYLRQKIFGTPVINVNPDQLTLTYAEFCKNLMSPENKFTFWEWYYEIFKLITYSKDLKDLWINGLIIGFISKQQAIDKLLSCAPGTFLLRFSDSVKGGISIAWVEEKINNEPPKVVMMQPSVKENISMRPLADQIRDLNQCVRLYSKNEPKDATFKKYYSSTTPKGAGYVIPEYKTTIPNQLPNHQVTSSSEQIDDPLNAA